MLKYVKPQIEIKLFSEDVVLVSEFEFPDAGGILTDDKYHWGSGDNIF